MADTKPLIELSSEGGRRAEKDGGKPETSQALAQVFDTLRGEGVSKADVAAELGIPMNELEKMMFGLVLTPIQGSANPRHARPGKPNLRVI